MNTIKEFKFRSLSLGLLTFVLCFQLLASHSSSKQVNNKASYFLNKADKIHDNGNIEKAHSHYLKSLPYITTKKEKIRAYSSLAVTYLELKDYQNSKSFCEKVLDLAPGSKWAKKLLVQVEEKKKRAEEKQGKSFTDFDIITQTGLQGPLERIFITQNNRYIIGYSDYQLVVWNLRNGNEVWRKNSKDRFSHVTSSDNNKFLLAAQYWKYGSYCELLDIDTGKKINDLEYVEPEIDYNEPGGYGHVSFSKDSQLLAISTRNGCLLVYNTLSGKCVFNKCIDKHVYFITFSDDKKRLVAITKKSVIVIDRDNGRIRLREPSEIHFYRPKGKLKYSGHIIDNYPLNKGMRLLCLKTADTDYILVEMSPESMKNLRKLIPNQTRSVYDFQVKRIETISQSLIKALVKEGDKLKLCDIKSGQAQDQLKVPRRKGHYAISSDCTYFVSYGEHVGLTLYDAQNGRKIYERYEALRGIGTYVSPDGVMLVQVFNNNTLSIWDLSVGKRIASDIECENANKIVNVSFSANKDLIFIEISNTDVFYRLGEEKNELLVFAVDDQKFLEESYKALIVDASERGSKLLISDDLVSYKIIDLLTNEIEKEFSLKNVAMYASFSPNADMLLVDYPSNKSSSRKRIKGDTIVYGLPALNQILSFNNVCECSISNSFFSFDGSLIGSPCSCFGTDTGTCVLTVYDVDTSKAICEIEINSAFPESLFRDKKNNSFYTIEKARGLINSDMISRYSLISGEQEDQWQYWKYKVNLSTINVGMRQAFTYGRDGKMRIISLDDGKEMFKFISFQDGEWLVVSLEGYYSASLHGHQYVQVGFGPDVYDINQFYDVFYRPDIVEHKLKGHDIGPIISLSIDEAMSNPPPSVKILNKATQTTDKRVTVQARIDDNGGGVGDVRVYHNGKLVNSKGIYRIARTEDFESEKPKKALPFSNSYMLASRGSSVIRFDGNINLSRVHEVPMDSLKGDIIETYDIDLIRGENNISISAFNGTNTITSAIETISIDADIPEKKPDLFGVLVGNNDFKDPITDLDCAVKDAKDFTRQLKSSAKNVYGSVRLRTLLNAKKTDIMKAFNELASMMAPEDVFIFYVASHGIAQDDLYYIIGSDFEGEIKPGAGAISSMELMEYSKKIPALKSIYVLDTCQSGGIGPVVNGLYDARISVLAKSLGMHVLSGAKTNQAALDNYKGNGLFTHFILEALKGNADANNDKQIFVYEMGEFLKRKVDEASDGMQSVFIKNFGEDFAISKVPID